MGVSRSCVAPLRLGRRGSNFKKVRLSIVQFFRDALSQNTGAASPDVLPRRNVSLIVAILAVTFILELPKPDVPNYRWGAPSAGINTFTQTHRAAPKFACGTACARVCAEKGSTR